MKIQVQTNSHVSRHCEERSNPENNHSIQNNQKNHSSSPPTPQRGEQPTIRSEKIRKAFNTSLFPPFGGVRGGLSFCFRSNDEVEKWNDGAVGNNPYRLSIIRLSKFSKLGKSNQKKTSSTQIFQKNCIFAKN